jgi:TRAP-type C4-dicarboxylate transport system substrate-binding protein
VSRAFVVYALATACSVAHADPVVLRMATIAPDGTSWAREAKAFGREVEASTQGQVQVKWYFGGIAGDELAVGERIRRGQLDGAAAASLCEHLAPSLRVMRIPGVFQQRGEHQHVLARLRPRLVEEFHRAGFEVITLSPFGSDIVFTRAPVHSYSDLKLQRLWVWDLDQVTRDMTTAMGMSTVPRPLEVVRGELEAGKLEGMLALPSAALAYQWSTRVKYFMDLRINMLPGCLVIASRAFERMAPVIKDDVREAGARMAVRFDQSGRDIDNALINGLFEKQGLVKLPVSDALRSAFFQAARAAREKLAPELVSRALLEQVLGWLADYRGEHPR